MGFGACPTETVLRNGVECDINIGDFNKDTDERIEQDKNKKVTNPLFNILDGRIKEVTDGLNKVNSIEDLDLLLKAEENGKTRSKVVKAIEERKVKLVKG